MANKFVQRVQDIKIGPSYQLLKLLGLGTFGKVYLGRNTLSSKQVAIKLEHHSISPSFLNEETEAYQSLAGQDGFPQIHWHGNKDDYRCLVMELLGPNLEDLFQYCGGRFSLKTTLMLADQLLTRFESLHLTGYLHRDIKPENFLLGRETNGNVVYMTDLGLASLRLPEHNSSVFDESLARNSCLIGTCRFASIQGHTGRGLTQKDDLEALGYMLVYFVRGGLPWQGLDSVHGEAKYQRVLQIKQATTPKDLCESLPDSFKHYMEYVRRLRSTDVPDYQYLRKLFDTHFREQDFNHDQVFDWTALEYQRVQASEQPTTLRSSKRIQTRSATRKKRAKYD